MKFYEAVIYVASGLGAASCASGQSGCFADTWSGTCQLLEVSKTKQVEFPLPSVTLEAVYRAQPASGSNVLAVPNVRREFTSLERHEEALRRHIESRQEARCYVTPPQPGQCQPGPLVIEVPEFDAAMAKASEVPAGPKGCAQIEAASAQDRIAKNEGATEVIIEHFEFGEGASELSPEAAGLADALATRLKKSPNLECVGVVGTWVRGESAAVAFARARAIKDLLVQRGVAAERLLPLTVDPVLGTGPPEPPNAKDRRVTLSVLLNLSGTKPEAK